MKYFLDTDTCIFALKGTYEGIGRRMSPLSPSEIKVPAIVLGELVCGAVKSSRPENSIRAVEKLLLPFEIVPFCRECALVYGRIRGDLELAGTRIGPDDLIIAATALAHDGTLVTHNLREFRRVEALKTQDWTV
jgi:tRNA(fMet)-specific endonuclease VapC